MLSKKMEQALNSQINMEIASGYLYLSMAAYFESENLPGFANWMMKQWQEEVGHGMKIYNYVNDRGGKIKLKAIPEPEAKWDSPLAAFEASLKHEKKVTESIGKLVDQALKEADYATNAFLQWFVTEQVEEEATVGGIVEKLKMINAAPGGLFMMDRELSHRQ
jgi:ferritin